MLSILPVECFRAPSAVALLSTLRERWTSPDHISAYASHPTRHWPSRQWRWNWASCRTSPCICNLLARTLTGQTTNNLNLNVVTSWKNFLMIMFSFITYYYISYISFIKYCIHFLSNLFFKLYVFTVYFSFSKYFWQYLHL